MVGKSDMGNAIRASSRGLEVINQLRKQRGWNRQAPAWYEEALTSLATLKRFLEGEPIQQDTFMRLCLAVGLERWQDIVEGGDLLCSTQPQKVWQGVPDVSVFYGRREELERLTQWLVSGTATGTFRQESLSQAPTACRLIALLGMGGIGKTALAAKLAEQVQDRFEFLVWRSLRQAPCIEDLLAELLQVLVGSTKGVLPESVEERMARLIDCLKQQPVLLVLDGFETLLSSGAFAGQYRAGYQGYGELLQRVGQELHQSCLLLTSREKTPEIALLEGDTLPVRSLRLEGLGEAAHELLQAKALSGQNQWSALIRIYRGNPLVLKIAAASIQELFDGDVTEFLKQSKTLITGDLSRFIAQQFDRLSPLEQQLAEQLALAQVPMSLLGLQQVLPNVAPHALLQALESLGRRSLIEKVAPIEPGTIGFTLQPAVVEYITHCLGTATAREVGL